ncbi:ribonuclease III domain-containing protein [Clohesyomyces aquaticus]|uniref:Large ribosomal subunit protein mL44 n=1 Tax=Clohesyomyces aquaticus TaxID=1231657 RepID=A0A1Y2A7I2_9PLEO|nr:ribonuclease III domain-containing protein [Clohesyomyces aquaticus]
MKRIRILTCGTRLLARPAPRRPLCPCAPQLQRHPHTTPHSPRTQAQWQSSSALAESFDASLSDPHADPPLESTEDEFPLEVLPSPHPHASKSSAKLAALRSRLSLPPRFPLETLARTLVHPSADPNPAFNNASLSILGANLLGYYTTEHLLCNYPRLPMEVVFAAQFAYIGPKALTTIAAEWGIEAAAEPGGEVDPGLLQFRRLRSGDELPAALRRPKLPPKWNITVTHKILSNDEFGSPTRRVAPEDLASRPVPLEEAAQAFVRALIGSMHLHLGSPAVKRFYRDHFLSRHLDLDKLFDFRTPTRDLSRLCAREGFEAPVARLISETGRLSRHPVFVVGVFSGKDKLGEGAGSSLDEARVRAAAAALKGWYLYKPLEVTVPSSTEGGVGANQWKPNMVDCGEVIV